MMATEKRTKGDLRLERIAKHGYDLLAIYPEARDKDPVTLCKALHRVETRLHLEATRWCNGEIDESQWDDRSEKQLGTARRILGPGPAIFANADARGYALKMVDDESTRRLQIHRDWGGYGIICPEID